MKAPLNTSDNKSISCKIYIKPGKHIRRINLAHDTPFEEFKKKLLDLIVSQIQEDLPPFLLHICYMDEEKDWITVDSEEEWKEALGNHVCQCLPEKNAFKVKVLIQSTKRSETSLLSNDLQFLFEKRTWDSLIEQVKQSGSQVKPYVDQMKEMAFGNAKKIQEWATDSGKQQELKHWICGKLERMSKEGQQAQHKISSWLGQVEQTLDSLLFPTAFATASETLNTSNNSATEHAEPESNEETREYYNNNNNWLLEMNDEEKQKEQEQELLMNESDQLYL